MGFIFVSDEFVSDLKQNIAAGDGKYAALKYELNESAKEFLNQGPWTITDYPAKRSIGTINDYYSEAPYFWPDPKDPTLPYIKKDGDVYPDRFTIHKNCFSELSHAVVTLASAGYYLDHKEYLDRAAEMVRIWFLDEKTRMNPHFNYGEAIINVCTGRKAGIIAATSLNLTIHGLSYLEASGYYADMIVGMKVWLREMMVWLTTSKIGVEESFSKNNHGSWWNTHVATCAAFIGDEEQFAKCVDYFKYRILDNQIRLDGLIPRELERTRTLHYTLFNLDAMEMMCELAYQKGIDLWNYETERGVSIRKAIEVAVDAIDNPFNWPHKQLVGDIPMDEFTIQYAGLRLNMPKAVEVNKKRSKGCYLMKPQSPLGPVVLLDGNPIAK